MMNRNENQDESFKKASEMLTRMSHDSDLPPRPGFKEALMKRILDARQHTHMPFFSWFNGLSPKFTYGGTVALVAVIILMLVLNPFSKTIPIVYAQNNFTLLAEAEDSLGIDPTTSFILESREPIDMDFVRAYLKSDIEVKFALDKLDDFRVRVTFTEKLTSGQMVRFLLPTQVAQADGTSQARPYSWAFQVKTSFHVLNSIPGDKTSSVPLDAGIEVNFSHENVSISDFERAFSVEPKLTGHVEKNRRRVVFVPDKLEPSTVYTVTINKSLHPSGSDEQMEKDYTFRFETSGDLNRRAGIHFTSNSLTSIPGEKAEFQISFQDYYSDSTPVDEAVFTVYRFPTSRSFKSSFEESFVDSWRETRSFRSYVPFETLKSVGAFKPEILTKDYYPTYQVPFVLEEGYYGIHTTWQGQETWTFLQSVSLTATLIKAEKSSLAWVHDANTKSPLSGARVVAGDVTATTDQTGVSRMTLPDEFRLLEISSGDRTLFLPTMNGGNYYGGYGWHGGWGNQSRADEDYVGYLYSDRTVYKKGDTVHVWGFLKHREEQPISLQSTLRITADLYSYNQSNTVEFTRQEVHLSSDGIFSGDIVLPDTGSGYYNLGFYVGDENVLSRSVQVQEYRKPVYFMELEVAEKGVILGDKVHFKAGMKYFDGTPVVGKSIDLSISGADYKSATLDASGTASGELLASTYYYEYANVHASIDEPGFERVDTSEYIRLYPSSIHLQGEAKIENNVATVSVDSRSVVMSDSDDRGDDIKTIRPNTTVDVQVTESYYTKIDQGTEYDFIRKSVRNIYSYEYHTRTAHTQTIVTDQNGHATVQFAASNADSSYHVELSTKDDRNRKEVRSLYAMRDFSRGQAVYPDSYDNTLTLRSRKVIDEYGNVDTDFEPNEEVQLEVQQFNKRFEMVENGSFLFFQAQRGIQEYQITKTPQYDFTFEERDVPNIYIYGVLFTGSGYVVIDSYGYGSYGTYIGFDAKNRELKVDIETNAEAYRPGGEAEVGVKVTDAKGNPVSTSVNISVVDEAYFGIYFDTPTPLSSLYQSLSSGIETVIVSHERKFTTGGAEGGGGGDGETRSNFVDTAAFVNLTTGNDGVGSTKIRLPDNVTSWRLTVHALDTKKIQAGVNTKTVSATLPFFINAAIQPTYLTEDQPEIIVTAQGTAVKLEDKIAYQISVEGTDIGFSMETTVGARAHLPLPKLPEGKQTILIKAKTGDKKDAISQVVTVVPSRLTIPVVEEYDLGEVDSVKGSETGLTWVTFVDANQGKFYRDLQWMSWRYGDRADEATVRAVAAELLNETFGEDEFVSEMDASAYQGNDGSIRLLSHADPDSMLSAKIALLGDTPFDEPRLQTYLLNRLYNEDSGNPLSTEEAAWVYAGLVALKTPIFAELKRFEQQELSREAQLAVAIAHVFAGDTEGARALYQTLMKDAKRELKYVWVERETPEETKEANAALYLLAAGLNEVQDRDGLNDYLDQQSSGQTLVVLEELLAVKQALAFTKPGASKFSYALRGEIKTIELKKGETATVAVNTNELKTLKPKVMSGDVSVILPYQKPISTLPETYNKIGVKRTYAGSFKAGELVLVTLTYSIDASLPGEYFEITDSVPSGLTPVTYRGGYEQDNTCITYPETDTDQTLTFFTYSGWYAPYCPPNTIRYYARVMNTGTFKAEPASIRAMRDVSLINFSNAQTITITP